jgi:hypothetical protein
MALLACTGAMMQCSFGVAPAVLNVMPANGVMTLTPTANIMDHVPLMNVPPFGMCSSPANPMVAAATAAALGVLTPMPCIPNTVAPWAPGVPTVLIGNMPALDQNSKLTCLWGGMIQISLPGEFQVDAG